MTGPSGRAAAALIVWLVALGSPLSGQAVGTLGIGASIIQYDGFLTSGAVVFAPAFRFETPSLSLGAQASWTRFESGNAVLQGTAAAAWLSRPRGWWMVELSGSVGASGYADEPGTGHALGGARVHFFGKQSGGWVGLTSGASFGTVTRVPMEIAASGWTIRDRMTLVGTMTTTWIGADRHVELLGAIRRTGARIELEARAGVRPFARSHEGVGDARVGVFGEVSGVIPMNRRIALTLSGGGYPSDPVRKVLAARYASIGLRLSVGERAASPVSVVAAAMARADRATAATGRARLEVAAGGDPRLLRVYVAGARAVELMGDFTDWAPVPLTRVGPDAWEARLPLSPGVHRLNVRIDGGPWLVPAGSRAEPAEFGAPAGVLVVP